MITLVELLKRKSGTTQSEFRDYYEKSHVMLARKYLGHLYHDYRRDYVNKVITVTAVGHEVEESSDGPYDCITSIVFENQEAVDEFFRIVSTPGIKEQFEADEKMFLDGKDLVLYFCEPVRTWTSADIKARAASSP
ncbi:MAG TPA: EthD domain-containing protein [Steroidobacteraceae bacterium]|nr:EthD domain-containing protein [Steroidobacteraceae bacterium]